MIRGRIPLPGLVPAIAAIFLLYASTAVAGNPDTRWKTIQGKTAEDVIHYDPYSVIPSGPDRIRVQVAGFGPDRVPRKAVEEYDCANRIVRDVEVVVEKPGKPAAHTFSPSDWRDVPRDTPRGELLKTLCR
ncbi:MAG: hypothetical protein AB1346_02645 [Thermodesulfobacteriota bacterium]